MNNNNKLILTVAISLSLLVNIPRIVFLFGSEENSLLSAFLGVSIQDTVFRFLSIFIYSLAILYLNIIYAPKWFRNRVYLKSYILSFVILIIWLKFHKETNLLINDGVSSTLSPRFNRFASFFVTIVLLVIGKTILLNKQLRIDALEKEKLIQRSLENELAALKNQVNPHFLFNSLNSLSLLVREDQTSALKFINKLSFLYRYILQSKDQNLISIVEELKFLKSYLYLIKQRYRGNFNAEIGVDGSIYKNKIPALALQFLVENAVKHNEISAKKPLTIKIFSDENYIIVKNKLQKRRGFIESTNIGLSNLNSRFKLLMNKEIIIKENDDFFIVKLPIT